MTNPEPLTPAELRPARAGGHRRLTFDNGRYEEYHAVFVAHPSGEWDRILIARDDGRIAALLADLINGAERAARQAPDTSGLREARDVLLRAMQDAHIYARGRQRIEDAADGMVRAALAATDLCCTAFGEEGCRHGWVTEVANPRGFRAARQAPDTSGLRERIEKVLANHATGTHVGHDRCVIDAVRAATQTP